ncbi:alpha/beta hydrolase [Streptacidiphilus sp. PB12-B1b]|nr:alpha/beta hydrolase [Streptacidiphilus sp. PB12-B1b]
MELFTDSDFNFQALGALGAAGHGSTEVGEVLTAVNSINAAGLSFQTFTDTFRYWGDRLARESAQAGRPGQKQTRRFRALRSSSYYEQALYYVLGTDHPGDEEDVYRSVRAGWDAFVARCDPPAELLSAPYGPHRMPVWFFRPDASCVPRPTVILTNGSDGQNVDMWTYGVASALGRGWNAVVYDGPGQGQMLFVDQVPFTPRWEEVVRPIVDLLIRRPDVDRRRIALTGFSLSGVLAPRAAAFDHRLAALVAGPGVVDPWLAFPADVRSILVGTKAETNHIWNTEVVPSLTADEAFQLKKRFEPYDAAVMRAARQGRMFTDFWTPAQVLVAMNITKVAGRITAPTLVVDFQDEQFFPGQARQLFDLLRSRKEYVRMTRAEGAQLHCSPMAPQHYCETIFDWLDETLDVRP